MTRAIWNSRNGKVKMATSSRPLLCVQPSPYIYKYCFLKAPHCKWGSPVPNSQKDYWSDRCFLRTDSTKWSRSFSVVSVNAGAARTFLLTTRCHWDTAWYRWTVREAFENKRLWPSSTWPGKPMETGRIPLYKGQFNEQKLGVSFLSAFGYVKTFCFYNQLNFNRIFTSIISIQYVTNSTKSATWQWA